jgi:hypothetical protein
MSRIPNTAVKLPERGNVAVIEDDSVLRLVLYLVDDGLVKGELLRVPGLHGGARKEAALQLDQGVAQREATQALQMKKYLQ